MTAESWTRLLAEAAARCGTDERAWAHFLRPLPLSVRRRIAHEWAWQAHGGQIEPPPLANGLPWRVWVLMAGRGYGKTRAGAEWVHGVARAGSAATQIALVSETREEAVRVMIEGPSGLIATARPDAPVRWLPTHARVEWPTGAVGFLYSAEAGEALRGPEHDAAWCDELAKWRAGEVAWDNLMLGLRRGERPRAIVTTTPRAGSLLGRILRQADSVVTGGRMADNPHLAPGFVAAMVAEHGGTRFGAQELNGELIETVDGSLFPRAMLTRSRMSAAMARVFVPGPKTHVERVVVGVDPPAGTGGSACGIVVMGARRDGLLIVLDDRSVSGLSPDGWARAVADAAADWDADRVVVEVNQGGDMVETVLRAADCTLPVKKVRARTGKAARAEPVAAMMEAGKLMLARRFPELEAELEGMVVGDYAGPGRSPDRADAMVWAASELMAGLRRREPRIVAL